MKSLWSDAEARRYREGAGLRVYTSRLLGRDPSLVLHGGGNTSEKVTRTNLFGEQEELLLVKGSGWDLKTIEPAGFSPVRLDHLRRLAQLDSLSDPQMVNELRCSMTDAAAPTPSVEAILHAILPWRFVDHTHADAIVTITNTPSGERRIREIYGDTVIVVPYAMPGFELARLCAVEFARQRSAHTVGMVLMNHGIFSFGDTARESYERMIELVDRAEEYLRSRGAWELDWPRPARGEVDTLALAELRLALSRAAGFPLVLHSQRDARAMSFCNREDLERISQQGPATPDHVIRTKRLPLVGRDVEGYVRRYRDYFEAHAAGDQTMLDPAPRVVLDPVLGVITAGRSSREARINADIYRHTMEIICRAEKLERWQALPARQIFDVEYWDLEQAKLRRPGPVPPFQGEVALVTGAASGIGRACVESLLARGSAVVALDIDPAVGDRFDSPEVFPITCDIADENQLKEAIRQGVSRFGGIDMLLLNAGIFPGSRGIAELELEEWRRVMAVNLEANLVLLRELHPFLKLAPNGGRVVAIGSRNHLAPGPGAAAYSCSKAALTQMIRVAALEWGGSGIRLNVLHPDCVYDTGIWSVEVLAARAGQYGMTVEQYKQRNLLHTEVSSRDVAELAAEMCGPLFAKTTGAQLPVDGGNERVI
ncbi:MAG TPA: bifunctional aldolase/short-chain dehydrogenase [Gammaproteobacteria bacterium]|nr:bifunctional aldolase/short-chain dehydrogenase [Gammaproteobacteria bacterium]